MAKPSADIKVTQWIAQRVAAIGFGDLSDEALTVARHCLLDWFAVTLPGAAEPASQLLAETLLLDECAPMASLVGMADRTSVSNAAVINGTASHALDYDDVTMVFIGHPTVAILPGLLALAEHRGAYSRDVITAFVAGYETVCRVGALVAPSHYAHGFHVTATAGSLGSAAACGRLLNLTPDQMAVALGLAATMGAGLKSMFGTMAKPLHAGRAAQNGLLAAQLAARGFTARADALECVQGFAATQSRDFDAETAMAEAPPDAHLRANLFKYHAACYLTHGAIEAAMRLVREHGLVADEIEKVTITSHPGADRVCNIPSPVSGLEAKFSLRLTVGMALSGRDTAGIDTYTDMLTQEPDLMRIRDLTEVTFSSNMAEAEARVTVTCRGKDPVSACHDAGLPNPDLANQQDRLMAKFMALVPSVTGQGEADRLAAAIMAFGDTTQINELFGKTGGAA